MRPIIKKGIKDAVSASEKAAKKESDKKQNSSKKKPVVIYNPDGKTIDSDRIADDDKIIVPKRLFTQYLKDAETLDALESGGVDNWGYYGESIHDYCEDRNAVDIDDLVKNTLDALLTQSVIEEYTPESYEDLEDMEKEEI